ncbi:MAG TPA: DnaJ domain-containing protein [Candidatus Limnocylindrales bacterium]|nr:DnaJ domain-containing protein [Candidatus Limnocylindrales bacterium]
MTQERDPYLVLGIARDATDRVVREAYYGRARRAHPDLVGSHGLEAMTLLNEAWAILKDPQRRAAYDAAHSDSPTTPTPIPQKPSATTPKPGWKGSTGQPEWTGAAGTPPGRPWGGVLRFGIYAGWSVGEVARKDRGYLVWLRDRPEGQGFAGEIDQLLDPRGGGLDGPARDAGTGRRR